MNSPDIAAGIALIFIPGLLLTYCFPGPMNVMERTSMALFLAFTAVPAGVFLCNLMGLRVDIMMVVAVIFLISLSAAVYIVRKSA